MGRILKWGGRAVLGLVLLACTLWAIAFAINAHDEELTPQARALLTAPLNPCPPADNIYVALAGFDAPPGESVSALGQAKIDYYNEHIEALLREPLPSALAAVKTTADAHLDFKGDTRFIQPADSSVWNDVPRHADETAKLLADNAELYRRYLALQELGGYYETARPTYLAPIYSVPNPVRKLFLAALVLRLRAADSASWAAALALLEGDIDLWRTVLTGDGTPISKIIAVAYLEADYLLLADMIADPQAPVPLEVPDADSVVPLFEFKSWDIGSAFAAKFRMMSSVFWQTDQAWAAERAARGGGSPWLSPLRRWAAARFFKPNATENLVARQTARQIAAAADPATFRKTRELPGVWLPESMYARPWPLSYNPLGKILVALADPHADNLVLRAWDGAALQRLVRLAYEIRRQRVAGAAIPAFLSQHPQWSTHPADGRPFQWDAGSGAIRVQTVAQQPPERRFSIHIWQAPVH